MLYVITLFFFMVFSYRNNLELTLKERKRRTVSLEGDILLS